MFKWSNADLIAIPVMLIILFSLAVLLYFLLRYKSEKIKNIPLHIISCLLIVLEVAKQIYYLASGNYPLSVIPAHFCSLIVVIIAFAQFLPRKGARFFQVPAVVFSIIVLLLLLVHPHSMIGSASQTFYLNFPGFHAFAFHWLVIAYPIFRLFLISHILHWKDFFSIPICILFYASYAVPIAFTLKFNYINILHSYFPPLESFRLSCGQVAYDIVLFLIAIAVCCILFAIWYFIDIIIKKRRNKKCLKYLE